MISCADETAKMLNRAAKHWTEIGSIWTGLNWAESIQLISSVNRRNWIQLLGITFRNYFYWMSEICFFVPYLCRITYEYSFIYHVGDSNCAVCTVYQAHIYLPFKSTWNIVRNSLFLRSHFELKPYYFQSFVNEIRASFIVMRLFRVYDSNSMKLSYVGNINSIFVFTRENTLIIQFKKIVWPSVVFIYVHSSQWVQIPNNVRATRTDYSV